MSYLNYLPPYHKALFVSVLLLFGHVLLNAQNGWEFIRSNDFEQAEKTFLTDLKADSTSKTALGGLIFISEMRQDRLRYKKYIETFIRHHDHSELLLLFKDFLLTNSSEIVEREGFSLESKLPFRYHEARQLKKKRKFHDSEKAFDNLIQDINWALCGPFKNESGSGYIKAYTPEKTAFHLQQELQSGHGYELKWVTPELKDESGKLFFQDHLPNHGQNVYYASTFLTFQEAQLVQFRLTRSAPIKVWLDNHLIFESNEAVNAIWDNERTTVSIKPGTHRVLIKYADYEPFDDSYQFLTFYDTPQKAQNGSLVLRITNERGELLTNFNSAFDGIFSDTFYQPSIHSRQFSTYFREQFNSDTTNLFKQYLLTKALLYEGYPLDAEQFAVSQLRMNPTRLFNKYLAAKCYAQNGKIERAYEVIGNLDYSDAPVFGVYWEKFQDLDMENDEQQWLVLLEKLEKISPSNKRVIRNYLRYYEQTNNDSKRENYIKQTMKRFPIHQKWLKAELEKSNKPRHLASDKEIKANLKTAQKRIKKEFNIYDYNQLIRHYKGRENFTKVISYYDDLINHTPYSVANRINKARFLYQNEKYDEALNELQIALTIAPFKSSTYELIGDIYDDQNKKDLALSNYYKASKHAHSRYIENILDKIEKLQGQRKLKSIFETAEFSSVLMEDTLWKKTYANEDAVVLLYTRDFVMDSAHHIEVYQKMLIKILTERGANDWTEYNYGFMGHLNHVTVIKPDGSEVRPDVSGGYVVCKHLKPGDLIEVEGTQIESVWRSELDYDIFNTHYLSFDDPLYYAKIALAVPKHSPFNYLTHKFDKKPEKRSHTEFDIYRWQFHNIAPIIDEGAIVDDLDLYAYIMTSSMTDWSKVVEWYQNKTYRRLEANYQVLEILDTIVNANMSDKDKVIAVYDYITKSVKYSYVAFLQSNYTPKRPGLTCSSGIGDCKDVATLMITMLRELGIEAYYVLVKSNHYDHEDMLPSLYFDHVIVGYVLDSEMHYLDLTTDYYPYYSLVDMDVGAVGLLIKEGVTDVFRLPNDHLDLQKNLTTLKNTVTLNEDRSIHMQIESYYPGSAGGGLREIFSRLSDEERRNYIVDHTGDGKFDHLELLTYTIHNLEDIDAPLHISYEFQAYAYCDEVMDLTIFSAPYTSAVAYHPIFSTDRRHNDIDLSQVTEIQPIKQELTINFPDGYTLVKKPKDIDISSKYGKYSTSFKATSTGLEIEKEHVFYKQHIPYSEFESLRTFYFQILEADATIIPLKTP